MKCEYQGGIQEIKNILNQVIQDANALRNEVDSHWRPLKEEDKEEVKEDYQLTNDNYVKMDDTIKDIERSLRVFIQNYNHYENNPCTCEMINDVGLVLIQSIFCKTDHLKYELYFSFQRSVYSFLTEAFRVMGEAIRVMKEPIINVEKSFKSNECVICLTNQPNVLFCNCGHIAVCEECDKMKSFNTCLICKLKYILNLK